MIQAAGIDLGGTKSEVQLFDQDWKLVEKRRDKTPATYDELVALLSEQVMWASGQAGRPVPIGLGAAGLLYPDGTSCTANLSANGKPLLADIKAKSGRDLKHTNDCRALALSEAIFGAGKGYGQVMALILGTGVGGGITTNGQLREGPVGTGGEFGHVPAAAAIVQKYNLPILQCGCGRQGCVETYITGPGLTGMAQALIGQPLKPENISARKAVDPHVAHVWQVWTEMTAELLLMLVQVCDPDLIVIAGGLSQIPGVTEDLIRAYEATQIKGFGRPEIVLAEGGDASGARGAAYAAVLESMPSEGAPSEGSPSGGSPSEGSSSGGSPSEGSSSEGATFEGVTFEGSIFEGSSRA